MLEEKTLLLDFVEVPVVLSIKTQYPVFEHQIKSAGGIRMQPVRVQTFPEFGDRVTRPTPISLATLYPELWTSPLSSKLRHMYVSQGQVLA